MYWAGKPVSVIAKKFNCHPSTVRKWVTRREEDPLNPEVFKDQPRAGRPKAMSSPQIKKAKRLALKGKASEVIAEAIAPALSQRSVSAKTIQRALKSGYKPLSYGRKKSTTSVR